MHPTHSVPALILASVPSGDADRRVCFLSQELGVLWAKAKSVREERSKLRYSLREYAHVDVSLVRGAYGWRVTGATHALTIPHVHGEAAFARIARLVGRLTLPDTDGARLYAPLKGAHEALVLATTAYHEIEMLTALRILHVLGYVAPRGEYAHVLESSTCTDEILALIGGQRTLVLGDINKALAESHL